jgi:hypothetical protein
MANSRKQPPKQSRPGTITEFPQPENTVAVADLPEGFEPTPETPPETPQAAAPPKRGRGQPKKTDPPVETNFFQRVAAVPAADWGTRVYLYLYQIEPVCDLKQSGGKAYLMRYQEPVRDEHQIMLEQGSGKYRLVLAYNKISPQASNEMARYDFEIYNPKYPPKIPREVWVNDQRNRRWEALLPEKPTPAAAGAASTMVEAMQLVNEIRGSVREEMGATEQPADAQSPSEMVQTFKAMKEILQPTPAAGTTAATAPVDPFDTAAKIMAMRANDPMMAVMMTLLTNANTANEAARQREYELLQKQAAAPPAKGLLDQLLELAALGDKLDPLKKLFGFGNGTAELAGRAARTTGLDVVRDLVTGPAGERLAQGIGVLIGNLASATTPNGKPAPTLIPNPALNNGAMPPQESTEERINRIGETVTRPMLAEYFMKNASGAEWAQAMFDLWPEDYVFMRTLGAENLVNRYRRYPQAWNIIAYREADFITFITEFCAWDPNTEDAPAPPANGDDGVVDLDSDKTEATA